MKSNKMNNEKKRNTVLSIPLSVLEQILSIYETEKINLR
jgi:hypothetical protein